MAVRSSSYQITATPVIIFAHLLVIAITTLLLVWLLHFREGISFNSDDKEKIFNLHPFFMVLGLVLLAGEGIMVYKSVPATRQTHKVFHLILLFIALVFGILGIYAVFKFHDERGEPHMVTLHSWIGISTICLFGLQWLFSFFAFFSPGTQMSTRANLAPWHMFLGTAIFFMIIVTAEMGLVQRFIILGLGRSQEALIVNFTGLLILLFAISVGFSILLPRAHY
ncbi:unnamed protein product [Rhodiola kirilowii]